MEYVLERDREWHWKNHSFEHHDENLLALVTILGGASVAELKDMCMAADWLPNLDEPALLRQWAIAGNPGRGRLAPLTPDLLGEFFVVTRLRKRIDADDPKGEILLTAIWQAAGARTGNERSAMPIAAFRTASDFGDIEESNQFLHPPPERAGHKAVVIWCEFGVDLTKSIVP
jgi:hypothetical protein